MYNQLHIKLALLLPEGLEGGDKRSRQIKAPVFFKALRNPMFSDAVENFKNEKYIFRGVQGAGAYPYWVINPKQHYRESRHTSNFYTGLIDRLPSWREWPKRSQSIICSSTHSGANDFGYPMLVFPKNGAKIGVCSRDDFWNSFSLVKQRLKMYSMDSFNDYWIAIFKAVDPILGSMARGLTGEIYDRWLELANQKVTGEEIVDARLGFIEDSEKSYFVNDVDKNFDGNWEHYFDEILNPEKNGFELVDVKGYGTQYDLSADTTELWTDGLSLIISANYQDEIEAKHPQRRKEEPMV